MKSSLITFDMASYLDSNEAIAEYLSQVLADGDTNEFLDAIGHIAKARGMSEIAQKSGLARENLCKILNPGAKPGFDTIMKVINALGMHLKTTAHTS